MKPGAVFAVPGDINALTGGYIYEKELLLALRRTGRTVEHLALPGSYPEPTKADLTITGAAFAGIAPGTPVILDGFLTGATDPEIFALLRAPFVAVTHHPLALETGLNPARANKLRRVERANLARAAHVIVPSPTTAVALTDGYGVPRNRITVIPPGTHRPAAQASGTSGETPLILSVGQLVPRKGHDTLIRALARLRDHAWRAVIVGGATDPDHAAELHELTKELGLTDRVEFAGSVAPDDLGHLYATAQIFALATHYEGYGMVFAEALAHGLPIVACAGGAVAETVPGDAGLLTDPGNVEGVAHAVGRLIGDPILRNALARAAARHGAALPSWDDAAVTANAILDRIVE